MDAAVSYAGAVGEGARGVKKSCGNGKGRESLWRGDIIIIAARLGGGGQELAR